MTMLREEAVAALDAITGADPEYAHGAADEILLAYADPSVAGAYERLMRRCTWWGAA